MILINMMFLIKLLINIYKFNNKQSIDFNYLTIFSLTLMMEATQLAFLKIFIFFAVETL